MLGQKLWTSLGIILVFLGVGCAGSGIGLSKGTSTFKQANLIRLRVIANSDSLRDQQVKLKVRDRIVQMTEPMLLKVEDRAEAEAIVSKNLPRIRQTAAAELARNGMKMPVTVTLGRFVFPDVEYPFGLLPAGEYKGLRVVLGEGKGKNWWCVLYPPLCLLSPDAPGFRGPVGKDRPRVEYRLALLEQMLKTKGLSMNDFWVGWSKFFGLWQ